MQPLKLTIAGDYYDSQIYAGCLYLWTTNGSILALDWNRLINSVQIKDELKLALNCAFMKSDYLYGSHWEIVYKDSEIKPLILSKFKRLLDYDYEFSESEIELIATKSERDNPFIFPHADADIYYNRLIVSSHEGIEFSATDAKLKNPIKSNTIYRSDIPALDIAPSNLILAVAAGSEGTFSIKLFDPESYSMRASFDRSNPTKNISKHYSSKVEWMFQTIAGMDDHGISMFAQYNLPKRNNRMPFYERLRYFNDSEARIIEASDVLQDISNQGVKKGHRDGEISWAERDKVCLLTQKEIQISKYLSWRPINQLENLGKIEIPHNFRRDYSNAKSANFGYIFESDDGLTVLQSDGEWYRIDGEVTNWRTFNRSTNYSNQLHVILDDRLEIYSFNNDYFVDQETKRIGLWHSPSISDQKNAKNEYTSF